VKLILPAVIPPVRFKVAADTSVACNVFVDTFVVLTLVDMTVDALAFVANKLLAVM
jgi:hypothetical protein